MGRRVQLASGEAELLAIGDAWEACLQRNRARDMRLRRDWLTLEASAAARKAPGEIGCFAAALWESGQLTGIAPFFVAPWRWRARLGYQVVASFPVRRAVALCSSLVAPAHPASQAMLLRGMLDVRAAYDVLYFEAVPLDSELWRLLQTSQEVRRSFWVNAPGPPSPHRVLRLPATFEAYASKWSGRTRRTLTYKVRRLEKACARGMRLTRVTRREELPAFLEQVERISRKSWQGTRLGNVITAATHGEKLGIYADRGWLRGYLLSDGHEGISFVLGTQVGGVFSFDATSYDPRWAQHHPGTVLIYRMVEDLFAEDRPELVDFGSGDNEYKRTFCTESYDAVNVWLVRKGAYTGVAYAMNRGCAVASRAVRQALDRLELRSRVRALLRGRAPLPLPIAAGGAEPRGAPAPS